MKTYRIYIGKNQLIVAKTVPKHLVKYQELKSEDFNFNDFYNQLSKATKRDFLILTERPKSFFKTLKKKLTVIKAAGGLVENTKGDFLFIFRNKKWDLPKGKVEKGEKLKITAVREVEEECGIKIERREQLICKTYHIYEMNGKLILKKTNWYKMLVKGTPKLIPQVEEGISAAKWVSPNQIKTKIKNTYALILDVLSAENLIA